VEASSARSSRQEQRCHRVVWLISRFESSGVVLLVIPRGDRGPGDGRSARGEERAAGMVLESGLSGLLEKRAPPHDAGTRECRWGG